MSSIPRICILLLLSTSLYSQEVKTPVERLMEVEVLFSHRQWEEALEGYRLLTQYEETAPEALYRIGECYYNLGEYDKAIHTFRDIIKRFPESYIAPKAIYAAGISFLARGDLKRAEEYLVKKIDAFPGYSEDKRTISGRGILLYFDGQYREALAHFEKTVTPMGRFYKARCLAHLGRLFEALAIFKELTNKFPGEPLAEYSYYAMGEALFYNRDYAGAIKRFEYFIEKYPLSHLKNYARYKLGCSYFNEGYYELAIACFRFSADSEDRYLVAHSYFMIGETLMKLDRIPEAIAAYQDAKFNYHGLRVAAISSLNYGRAYIALEDTLASLIAFNQLASIYPTGSFAGMGDYLAGVTFFSENRYLEAIDRFHNIIRFHSVSEIAVPAYAMMVKSYTNLWNPLEGVSVATAFEHLIEGEDCIWADRANLFLGELFYYIDRIPEATAYFETVLERHQTGHLRAHAFVSRAWCILEQGRYGIAKGMFEEAFHRYGVDTCLAVASLYGWGIAAFNMGEHEEAYQVFLFGIGEAYPDHPIAGDALYYGAKALFVTGKFASAIEYWEKVLNYYPDAKKAPDAAFQLATTYAMAGEFGKSANYFRLLMNQYPMSELVIEAQFQLATTYFNSGDFLNAIREYDKFRLLYPDDVQAEAAQDQLELAYFMLGQEDPEALDILIREHPTSEFAAEAQWTRAGTLFNDGDLVNAIIEFRKLLVNFPESPYTEDALYFIVISYGQINNFPKQIEEAEKFKRFFPESEKIPALLNTMGVAYHNLGKFDEALKVFKRVLNEYPGTDEYNRAGRFIGQTYRMLGDAGKADEYLTRFGE